ncbi:MAG: NHL repeat-containing protein [Leptothrix sp. (in: b-proteobacteria)]
MKMQQTHRRWSSTAAACTMVLTTALVLWSCGGGTQGQMGRGATTYAISGKVAGLARGEIVLQNGVDTSSVKPQDASGNDIEFTIAKLPSNAKYDIQIASKPEGTDCRTINGAGTIQDQAVSNIIVQCFDVKSLLLVAGAPYTQPSQNSTKEDATFSLTGPATVDSQGNIFVIDRNAIRRISTTNIVTTLAGLPDASGNAIGNGRQARFFNPNGIAVDDSDRIIVADTGNNAIKQITQTGDVSVIATAANAATTSSGAASVALASPSGLAYDKGRRKLYLADSGNHVIRALEVGSDGKFQASVMAGVVGVSGAETDPVIHFSTPTALAIDANGNVIVADRDNYTIRRLSPDGMVTNLAGSSADGKNPVPTDGTGNTARLSTPTGVTITRNGTIYVAEKDCNRVRRIDAQLQVSTVISAPGCHVTNQGDVREFNTPVAVTALPDETILVSDLGSSQQPGATLLRLVPREVAVDKMDTIEEFAGVGSELGFVNGKGSRARFNFPQGIAADKHGLIYVVDTVNNAVRKIDVNGQVTTLELTTENKSDKLTGPSGLAIDADNNIYISDTNNHVIRKIDAAGRMTLLAGNSSVKPAIVDGTLENAQFISPGHMVLSPDNCLYLLDATDSGATGKIRKIDLKDNSVVTLTVTGLAANIRAFSIDSAGEIYAFTADPLNRRTLFHLVPAGGKLNTYNAQAMRNSPGFTVSALTFENKYTAYAYTDRGIYMINIQSDGSISWAAVVGGNGGKTTTGPLPANVAVPVPARNGYTIYSTGMLVRDARLIFTDNLSIYAMTL